MRAGIVACLLLPVAAALSSTKCISNCLAGPQLFLFEKSSSLIDPRSRHRSGRPQIQPPTAVRDEMCGRIESVKQCLNECESSEQQKYFLAWTTKWHAFGCNGTEEDLNERISRINSQLRCFDTQDEELLTGIAGAFFLKGGNPTRSEAENLCDIILPAARLVNSNRLCSDEAKATALELIENLYRFVAVSLGMEDIPEKCRNFLESSEDEFSFEDVMSSDASAEWQELEEKDVSTACMQGCLQREFFRILSRASHNEHPCTAFEPIVECFDECPRNKLQYVAAKTGNVMCNRESNEFFIQCFNNEEFADFPRAHESQLQIAKQLITAGANSSVTVAKNLCDIYTTAVGPALAPIRDFVESTNNTLLAKACFKAYRGLSAASSVPLRLVALKLGINQEDIDCDDI